MSKNKKIIIIIVAAIIAAALATISIIIARTNTPGYVYLDGVVTAYDTTPATYDGMVIFSIDNTSVDIGGGLRPSSIYGDFDQSIKLGDIVAAKLKETEYGSLTIYDCADCYVRKNE